MSAPIQNETDFVAEPHVLVHKDGERLCAIVKATFELADGPATGDDGSFTLAPKDRRRGVRGADVPWGKPEVSSIRYPSDLCVHKPGTDVIVVACAYAPESKPVTTFDAAVRIARLTKIVRLVGPRVWLPDGGLSDPQPMTMLPMRYELAFGGVDMSDPGKIVEEPRNPVGSGVARDPASLAGRAAPQIEDPGEPIKSAGSRPKPAGLGPIGRHWEPRRRLWGTYGGDWVETRAPLPPEDFDERANLFAPEGLVAAPPLAGGEEGGMTNLTLGGGTITFVLPRPRVEITFRKKGKDPQRFTPPIDTLVLDTVAVAPPAPSRTRGRAWVSPLTIEMVVRASVPMVRRAADCEIVVEEKRK
jgi:hypothetical protein